MSDAEADDEDPLARDITAATRVLEEATVDAAEEEALWQQLVIEVFTQQLRLDGDAKAFAAMTNARLKRDHVPFCVLRMPTP